MTEKKKEITERLEREFDVCDKHILRINEALEGLGVNIPMSADCYSNLTTDSDIYWNIWMKTSPHFLCVTF